MPKSLIERLLSLSEVKIGFPYRNLTNITIVSIKLRTPIQQGVHSHVVEPTSSPPLKGEDPPPFRGERGLQATLS